MVSIINANNAINNTVAFKLLKRKTKAIIKILNAIIVRTV
jgi:hypothetical protein